jgi:hypothetical protein
VFLRRRGLPGWGATLATLPVLLDPLQLVLEHYVLSDVLFEMLLIGACLLVLWRPRPGIPAVALAGALLGYAAFVRGAGMFLLAVFVIALICLRVGWVRLVAFLVAAIIPLGWYATAFHDKYGKYAISEAGPRFLYARLAPIVKCHDPQLKLPSYEKRLCPKAPISKRPLERWYMWGKKHGPQWNVLPPPNMTQVQMLKDFDKRVIRAQPGAFSKLVLADVARGFSPFRTAQNTSHLASYWLFQNHYWSVDEFIKRHMLKPSIRAREHTGYRPNLANFLVNYRKWIYTPGPLMVGLLLVGAAAALGFGRSRRSGNRVAIGLMLGACVLPLATADAVSGFAWRYQLPSLPLLPMAGALGLVALLRGPRPGAPTPAPPLRILDRAAAQVARLPMPAAARTAVERAADRGWIQAVVAVLAGAVATAGSVLVVAHSGWLTTAEALPFGLAFGVAVAVMLLVARARAGTTPPPPGRPPREPPTGTDQPDESGSRVSAGT